MKFKFSYLDKFKLSDIIKKGKTMNLFLKFYTYDLINLSNLEGAYCNDEGFVYHANKISSQILKLTDGDEIETIYIKLIDEPEFKDNKYVQNFIDIVCSSPKVKLNLSGHTYNPKHLVVPEESCFNFKEFPTSKPMICFTPWSHSIFEPLWIENSKLHGVDQNFYVALNLEDDAYMNFYCSNNVKQHKKLWHLLSQSVINWRNDSDADIQPNANTRFVYGQQISYFLYRFDRDLWEIKKAYVEAVKSLSDNQNYIPQENKDEGKKTFGSWL